MKRIKKTSDLRRFLPFLLQAPFPAQGRRGAGECKCALGCRGKGERRAKGLIGEVRPLLKSGGGAVSARAAFSTSSWPRPCRFRAHRRRWRATVTLNPRSLSLHPAQPLSLHPVRPLSGLDRKQCKRQASCLRRSGRCSSEAGSAEGAAAQSRSLRSSPPTPG